MSVTDTKASEEASRREGMGEQEQWLGAVFRVTVAISAVFVLWGVLFTENFASATAPVFPT